MRKSAPVVMILAHRGASSTAADNTVAAFAEARRLGVDGVELDVRRSADGALVVHHDVEVPGLGPIAALRAAQLPFEVPLLEAAVDACGGMIVNIELKDLLGEPGYDPSSGLARTVARFVGDRDLRHRVVVSSFDLLALDAAIEVEPALVTGWLTTRSFDQRLALATVIERGHHALHPHHDAVTAALVDEAHSAGIAVTTWTADDPTEIRRLAALGVDGIITNVPAIARAALGAAGTWGAR